MTENEQLQLLDNIGQVDDFSEKLKGLRQYPVRAAGIEVFQMNVGRRCNLSCRHCHVDAGPDRAESMGKEIYLRCLEIVKASPRISTIDITGGAPEMSPHFAWFVEEASRLGKRLLVRSNLVILLQKEYAHFIDLFAACRVEVVGSLPDYSPGKADRLRGEGNFSQSVRALQLLNERGYGKEGTGLALDLVHNPAGAYLPGPQEALQHEYKHRLRREFGVEFDRLFCITNLPVGRYLEYLRESDNLDDYVGELDRQFNRSTIDSVMCRTMISVGWDGRLYDCDFNQMLGLGVAVPDAADVFHFDAELLATREIVVRRHCYGCTAGAGSSCQGAFV